MAVTATRTVGETIKMATRLGGLIDVEEDPTTEENAIGIEALNLFLKSWQNVPFKLWTKTEGTLTLTTATEYTLSPVRPLEILGARYWDGSRELPMFEMTRAEYFDLPVKTTPGTPHSFYYDRQKEAAKLYIWQPLASVTSQEIRYTYTREIEDVTDVAEVLDAPGETWEFLTYGLAVRMCNNLNSPAPGDIMSMYQMLEQRAEAFDREDSLFFGDWGEYHGAA